METPTEAPEAPTTDDGLGPETPADLPEGGYPEDGEQPADEVEAARQRREQEEAGESGEEAPPAADLDGAGDGAEETEDEDQIALIAFRKLGVKVGGRKPDGAVLKIKGGKVELGKTQFDREDRFPIVSIVQVVGDADRDKIDKGSGEVKSTQKTQEAEMCSTQLLGDYLRMKLADEPELCERVLEALDLGSQPVDEAA